MLTVKIEFGCGTQSFKKGRTRETIACLRRLTAYLDAFAHRDLQAGDSITVHDSNGNGIGTLTVVTQPPSRDGQEG